jgi:hypothetical protein
MRSAVVELDQFSPDWSLQEPAARDDQAPWVFRTRIHFDSAFANVPIVHVGLTGFTLDNHETARLSVRTADVSATGFDLLVLTWLHSRAHAVEVSWIAVGHQSPG